MSLDTIVDVFKLQQTQTTLEQPATRRAPDRAPRFGTHGNAAISEDWNEF
ncbi:hypothetical protein PSQ19_11800 [Devosia algicola]|uniref:Uncharacterized protein n=1 Tax=Devosia algicola TaxID=3026418 RepID=A0ABY7YJX6_9HYPH|nr:hypothetical protein [Devosia algicola]WDR01482.1 hypothetical protein PSQ19_11800 [Devosia algicola]